MQDWMSGRLHDVRLSMRATLLVDDSLRCISAAIIPSVGVKETTSRSRKDCSKNRDTVNNEQANQVRERDPSAEFFSSSTSAPCPRHAKKRDSSRSSLHIRRPACARDKVFAFPLPWRGDRMANGQALSSITARSISFSPTINLSRTCYHSPR